MNRCGTVTPRQRELMPLIPHLSIGESVNPMSAVFPLHLPGKLIADGFSGSEETASVRARLEVMIPPVPLRPNAAILCDQCPTPDRALAGEGGAHAEPNRVARAQNGTF